MSSFFTGLSQRRLDLARFNLWPEHLNSYFACLNLGIFNGPKKNFRTVYSGISEQIKPLWLVGQTASSSLSPSSSPCLSSVSHSRRLFQKTIERSDREIHGRALGATLQHRLDGSDGQAQTDGGTRAAVAADRDRLAWASTSWTR